MKYCTHNCGELRVKDVGTTVKLVGWVDSIRHYGKIAFINLRDRYGITQVVVKNIALIEVVKKIGHEWVISITGTVLSRPEGMANPKLLTGDIDVEVTQVDIISQSNVPPFVITDDTKAKDELRLRYRYLDLRRHLMQYAIIFKSHLYHAVREYLHGFGFVDVETPILGRSTPEGARDFLVPSRLQPGKFYSLVQSPQIYKQLLMIAGFDKYYQLARCLRDEDQRKDRQLEFTQLDIEMAFVEEDDILELIEGLMKYVFKKLLNIEIATPFKRMQYKVAIEKYGSDKPDIRYDILLQDVTEVAKKSEFQKFKEKVKCLKFERELSRKEIDELETIVKGYGMELYWIKYTNGNFSGPICKFFTNELLEELKSLVISESSSAFVLLFTTGNEPRVSLALGGVRNALIAKFSEESGDLISNQETDMKKNYEFMWVIDFPMFERDENTNQLMPSHHVFVMPKDPKQLENKPENAIGKLYDLVLNGVELGTGSIRVHNRELQEKIMEIIGFDKENRGKNFGCLLEALEYGAPPHGGIALGLDRLIMTMLEKKSIQDVIAFPKTLTGLGLLEGIPSEVEPAQLDEVHIKVKK